MGIFKKLKTALLIVIFSTGAISSAEGATAETLSALPSFTGTSITNTPGVDTGEINTGDFNCDGIKDLVISSGAYSISKGRIYVRFGGSAFLSGATTLTSTNMDVTITGSASYEGIGGTVILTDVNNDGCDDIVSGGGTGLSATGTSDLYVYLGNSSWSGTYTNGPTVYAQKLSIFDSHGWFYSYSWIYHLGALDGDRNADGVTDNQDTFFAICSNSTTKCYLMPLANILGAGSIQDLSSYHVESTDPHESITSGDIDGDGTEDLVVASPDDYTTDNVSIFFGPLSSSASQLIDASATPSTYFVVGTVGGEDMIIADTDSSISGFGDHLEVSSLIGDDGYADIVIGNNLENGGGFTNAGRAHIISGASLKEIRDSIAWGSGILIYNDTLTGTINYSDLDTVFFSGDTDDAELAGMPHNSNVRGDLNGDGRNDLLIGGSRYNGGGTYYGINFVVYGGDLENQFGNELTLSAANDNATKYLEGLTATDGLSHNVVVGDVTGDGLDDAFIAADTANSGYGVTYVLQGAVTDVDGDGFDSARDSDGDGRFETYDCNDQDAGVFPSTWFADADGDGQGDSAITETACTQPAGYVANSDDCNDANNAAYPGAGEICDDGVDQDCDGGDTVCVETDADGDGYTVSAGDCDDTQPAAYPGAVELGDAADNDCDGKIDEGLVHVSVTGVPTAPLNVGDAFDVDYEIENEAGLENFTAEILINNRVVAFMMRPAVPCTALKCTTLATDVLSIAPGTTSVQSTSVTLPSLTPGGHVIRVKVKDETTGQFFSRDLDSITVN